MIKPIVLRCQARSGSTYLMNLMSNFPDIVVTKQYPYEIRMAQYFAACYETLSGQADHENSSRPNFFHRDKGQKWIGTNPFNHKLKNSRQQWILNKYNPSLHEFFCKSVEGYYANEAKHQSKNPQFFCEKSFYINRGPDQQDANVLSLLFPDSIDIYLVRHPFDILISQMAFFQQDRDLPSEKIKQIIVNLAKHMNRMVSDYQDRPSCVIYYEDLIADPVKVLLSLSNFLQLDSSTATLTKAIHTANSNTENKHITSKSPHGSVKRWKRELPAEFVPFAEIQMREYLEIFSYNAVCGNR